MTIKFNVTFELFNHLLDDTLSCPQWITLSLAPTCCSQGSQPLTWAQAKRSCWARCRLCPFWAITHAATLLWTFRTLLPSLLSLAPAPPADVVCRSRGLHTWVTQRVSLCYFYILCPTCPEFTFSRGLVYFLICYLVFSFIRDLATPQH